MHIASVYPNRSNFEQLVSHFQWNLERLTPTFKFSIQKKNEATIFISYHLQYIETHVLPVLNWNLKNSNVSHICCKQSRANSKSRTSFHNHVGLSNSAISQKLLIFFFRCGLWNFFYHTLNIRCEPAWPSPSSVCIPTGEINHYLPHRNSVNFITR